MGFFIIFIIFIIIIIFIFSSPTLSPIPYFPSQKTDLPKIIKALNLKSNQTVFDLGAGDGIVIFKAALSSFNQKLNTKFIAVEINPILILILHLRRLFHPNRRNIKIIMDDMFKMNLSVIARSETTKQSQKEIAALPPVARNDIVVYLYISPWYLEKVISNLKFQISNFKVVSYMYPIKSLSRTTFAKATVVNGKNKIFVYN